MDKKSYRKERLNFRLYNLKKSWRLFYSSKYGKIGFYILVVFVILSLISPLIIQHSNSLTYIAPEGDFTAAHKQFSSTLPSSNTANYIDSTTSGSRDLGTYLIYTLSSSGVYGVDTCNHHTYNLASINHAYNLTAFTAYNSGEKDTYSYVITANSSELFIGKTTWSSSICGHGTPTLSNKSISMKNVVAAPFTSAFSYHSTEITSTFEYDLNYHTSTIYPVYIYTITKNATGYYLNEYYMYNLLHTSNHKPIFSQKLPYNIKPGNDEYYAAGLTSKAEVLVSQGSHITGYYTDGTIGTNKNLSSKINEVYIPSSYQYLSNNYNQIFVSTNHTVYGIYPLNNTKTVIFNTNNKQTINYIASTSGSTGFPSYFLVSLSNKTLSVLNNPNSIVRYMKLPVDITGISRYSGNFLLYNNHDYLYLPGDYVSSGSYIWTLSISKVTSTPIFLLNPVSARESISISYGNTISVYSTSGEDLNPMPPTFHTISGNIFPLGTTVSGNDVWSEFIGGFPVDLEIGLAVGIGILIISLVIGMLIGYFAGIVSSGFETFALAIYLIPNLPLLIVVAAIVGPSLTGIIMVLTLLSWPFAAFTLIGIIRSLKTRSFVDAAKVSGASTLQILKNHMLKNVTPILVYLTSINIGGAVAAVSTLQVLGIAPLTVPTWGGMLDGFYSDAFDLAIAPWWFIPPIIAITLFIMAFIFVSRGMDNVVNPRVAGGRR